MKKFGLLLIVSLLVIQLLSVVSTKNRKIEAATPTKTALVIGDSLTEESTSSIYSQFSTKKKWTVKIRAKRGSAPCTWIPWLNAELNVSRPTVVAIETAGNEYGETSTCMVNSSGQPILRGTAAFYNKYRADLAQLFSMATTSGSKVVFVQAPPMLRADYNNAINQINIIVSQLAGQYRGVSISDVPRKAVTKKSAYTDYLSCLAHETAMHGCINKKIAVRTVSGSGHGTHFCPTAWKTLDPLACGRYSSGEYRWAKALFRTINKPPAPVLP
jgi:hypothetical protein